MQHVLDKKTFFDECNRLIIRPDDQPIINRLGIYGIVNRGARMLFSVCAHSGFHDLPGGKLEVGETIDECLEREGREETGYALRRTSKSPVVALQRQFYWSPSDTFFMSMLLIFLARIEGPRAENWKPHDPSEVADACWVRLDDLRVERINPCYVEAIRAYLAPTSFQLA